MWALAYPSLECSCTQPKPHTPCASVPPLIPNHFSQETQSVGRGRPQLAPAGPFQSSLTEKQNRHLSEVKPKLGGLINVTWYSVFLLKTRLSRKSTVQLMLLKNRFQKFFGEKELPMSIWDSDYTVWICPETELAPFSPQTTHKPPVLNKIVRCLSEAMQIECIKPQVCPQVLKLPLLF